MHSPVEYCGGYILLVLSCMWDLIIRILFPERCAGSIDFCKLWTSFIPAETQNGGIKGPWTSFLSMIADFMDICTFSPAISPGVDLVSKVARVYSRHILQLPREIRASCVGEQCPRESNESEDMWGFHVDLDTEVLRLPPVNSSSPALDDQSCGSATLSLDLLRQWESDGVYSLLQSEPPTPSRMVRVS